MSPRPRRPTLADVARAAGTSATVVSYVVNNGPRPVSSELRARVEEAIDELGYRRNSLAEALSVGRSNLVGVLVPDSSNAFFGELARHVEHEARSRSLLTLLGNTEYDPEVERGYERTFADLRTAGTLLVTIDPASAADSAPRVFLHSAPPTDAEPSVVFDDEQGARSAVAHLLAHGYDDLHCVTGPDDFGPSGLRARYWAEAVTEAGGRVDGRLHRVPMDRVSAEQELRHVLRSERPRAVFATTDEHALALLRAASQERIDVPAELAIVGFDGIREALLGGVRVTTVAVPVRDMARIAFELLDESATGAGPRHVLLPTTLVVGETCGCPPSL
ncbi:LacI family DNA-binding transcriptional regulator [Rathayibacter sp. VKM Ac-2754]|uniref:LacI family DNA-binding transcriptional regulator n=1 Tax=Rathayibacter sp. VKM Ac-2754 TaxID=2609251 RepID=UPI00135830EA|nr:LacI family DNA-binding transcriptional regulator [Rathayibacter sp. VKM Ac-2754]MWV59349.1 LacI family DNA-binding transcriptional regulator [Rathayibacter sp. VKM Ac-2754]